MCGTADVVDHVGDYILPLRVADLLWRRVRPGGPPQCQMCSQVIGTWTGARMLGNTNSHTTAGHKSTGLV